MFPPNGLCQLMKNATSSLASGTPNQARGALGRPCEQNNAGASLRGLTSWGRCGYEQNSVCLGSGMFNGKGLLAKKQPYQGLVHGRETNCLLRAACLPVSSRLLAALGWPNGSRNTTRSRGWLRRLKLCAFLSPSAYPSRLTHQVCSKAMHTHSNEFVLRDFYVYRL